MPPRRGSRLGSQRYMTRHPVAAAWTGAECGPLPPSRRRTRVYHTWSRTRILVPSCYSPRPIISSSTRFPKAFGRKFSLGHLDELVALLGQVGDGDAPALVDEVRHLAHLLGRDVDELPPVVHHPYDYGSPTFASTRDCYLSSVRWSSKNKTPVQSMTQPL